MMRKQPRRPLMTISLYGITYFHRQNPYMVAWMSALFPVLVIICLINMHGQLY